MCTNADSQLFKAVPVTGGYQLVAKHSNKCVEIPGAATGDGVDTAQAACVTGQAKQVWKATNPATNGTLLERTIVLPGGVMLTTRAGGNIWSYPNLTGDTAATANQAGVKQGVTTTYDPFGGITTGVLADNSADNMDYGWKGQHQRPLEHATGLTPTIEMGARQYSPTLGRFLETDAVAGGSCCGQQLQR